MRKLVCVEEPNPVTAHRAVEIFDEAGKSLAEYYNYDYEDFAASTAISVLEILRDAGYIELEFRNVK